MAFHSLPLCVDLDGTLIRTDVLQESILVYVMGNPFRIFQILFWVLRRGRPHLKYQLGRRVSLNPAKFTYNPQCLAYLQAEKKSGRALYLVTAADESQARPVADFTGLFDGVMASDGTLNLRSTAKARALVHRFGNQGFVYMGNSSADIAVWKHSAQVIAVNTPKQVLTAASLGRPDDEIQILDPHVSPFPALLKACRLTEWIWNGLIFLPAALGLGGNLFFGPPLWPVIMGFLAFSALGSGIFLIQDLRDLQKNKSGNLASGIVPVSDAMMGALFFLVTGAVLGAFLPWPAIGILCVYGILNHCLKDSRLKTLTIISLTIIRLMAGWVLLFLP